MSGEDPQSKVEVLDNAEIDPDTTDNIVLIQPQKVKLTLRPGVNFINILQAAFAPVDPKSVKRY